MIKILREENAIIVEVPIEELDMYNVPELREEIVDALEIQPQVVILDLKEVQWLDSSAIGLLFLLQSTIKKYGGTMALAGLTGNILKVFQSLQIMEIFAHYDSAAEALSTLKQAAA